ncbi:rhamnogalacturonan acetylesterase [Kiritimatiellota bacterium B12222]|nr:rhamnogalacturonan acetylesterase [Kiritimatiellota bacterium B12222]
MKGSILSVVSCCLLGFATLCAEEVPPPEKTTTIYMIGDSTMANKSTEKGNPMKGWGQVFQDYVLEDVVVANRAVDGRSSRSFVAEGRWDKIMETLQPGDWVVIQFGHNDQKKKKPAIYTDPEGDYREFLTGFVNDTRAKGANPVLVTSIYRRYFTPEGRPKNSLGKYPQATREVAAELDVPMVDLNVLTGELLAEVGEEDSKDLFVHFEAGEQPYYPNGIHDNSHLSEAGARSIAQLFAEAVLILDIDFPVKAEQ